MKSGKQKRLEIKAARLKRAKKLIGTYDPHQDQPPIGSVAADHEQLRHSNTYDMLPNFYIDKPFICKDCGSSELWTAKQQKWWYEIAKGNINSTAVRCNPCRKKETARKDNARKIHLEGIETKDSQQLKDRHPNSRGVGLTNSAEAFVDVSPGKLLNVFSTDETKAIEKEWVKAFCENKLGFGIRQFKWHIFSGGGYPSSEGSAAIKEYETHVAPEYIVLSNDDEPAFSTDKKPDNLHYKDVYVFPKNFSWTMAFTHEEGWLGPYFARHKDYVRLEEKNKHLLEKLLQAKIAKIKGWH